MTQRCCGWNSSLGTWAPQPGAAFSEAGSAGASGPTPEEPSILLHAWQTPLGLLASQMAYFSTVFKMEGTNRTSQRGRQGQTLLHLVLSSSLDGQRAPAAEELLGAGARVPAEWGSETSSPCSRDRRKNGNAIGTEAGPPGGQGCREGGCVGVGDGWLWNHLRPSPLLPPRVQATLGESPDLLMPWGLPVLSERPHTWASA